MKKVVIDRKQRVLIVDNDSRARESYQVLLKYWGYEPILAIGEGRALVNDAMIKARQARCILALIDLRLFDDYDYNDTSGLELVREIGPIPTVIMSGTADPKVFREIIEKHKDTNFLGKGDSPETIKRILDGEARKVSAAGRGLSILNNDLLDKIISTTFSSLTEEYPDQIVDILAQLFPRATKLRLEKLDSSSFISHASGVPRPQSVVLRVYEDDLEPVVVKLARAKKIGIEVDRYEKFISRRLAGNFNARLERNAILWDIGGARYSYVGDFNVKTFSRYYQEEPMEDIKDCLDSFFTVAWGRHYEKRQAQENISLFDLYGNVWGDWYEKRVQNFVSKTPLKNSGIYKRLNLPEPIEWFRAKIAETSSQDLSLVEKTFVAVTHGDLHGDNLLIDSKRNAWVIDFERSGEGHILQDFIELEADIINRLEAHNEDLPSYYHMCLVVASQTQIKELEESEMESRDPGIRKALQTISVLRALALQCTEITDARQYLLGLLFNTIFRATIAHNEHDCSRQSRALLLASIFSHRLDHWDEPWPPEEWKAILQT